MRRLSLLLPFALAAVVAFAAGDPPVRRMTLVADPPKQGKQTFTAMFAPRETKNWDRITFECPLRQDIVLPADSGGTRTMVREFTTYTYVEEKVRFVTDLDKYISFMVLVDPVELREQFGATSFRTNFPVTIPRIKITAFNGEKVDWQITLPVPGEHPAKSSP